MAINAYTISKLARDAGVSPSLIRDYEWRSLVRPREVTRTGLRIYDRQALQRLRFVLEGKVAGIALDDLSALCQALDAGDREELDKCFGLSRRWDSASKRSLPSGASWQASVRRHRRPVLKHS